MKRIVSVSRRTDVPAYYSDWFTRRMHEGYAAYSNPYTGTPHRVSLRKEDVHAFVFWSKRYAPFLPVIETFARDNVPAIFHFTITALPAPFEADETRERAPVVTARRIADYYSPRNVIWRYDPIVFSEDIDATYHTDAFTHLADALTGSVTRVYVSFVHPYAKVARNVSRMERETGHTLLAPSCDEQRTLADRLAAIACDRGITLFACSSGAIESEHVRKGACVDRALLADLYDPVIAKEPLAPGRKGCGCARSVDIGAYDTCPHGCVYCYANVNKKKARGFYADYLRDDGYVTSAFLGKHARDCATLLARTQ